MTTTHTHVVVQETPPPDFGPVVVGHLYGIEPVFKTFIPDYAPNAEVEEGDDEEEVETKVVRRGRRPKPKANELAETK
jgi:hypothetical protein